MMQPRYSSHQQPLRHSLSMDPPAYHPITNRSRHYSSPFASGFCSASVAESLADSLLIQSHDEGEEESQSILMTGQETTSTMTGVNRCHSVPSGPSFDDQSDTIMWPEDDPISKNAASSGFDSLTTGSQMMMDPIQVDQVNFKRCRLRKRILPQMMHNNSPSNGESVPSPTCMDQDLQTTLDDLRDCDNDFSRFAQELEASSSSIVDTAFTD